MSALRIPGHSNPKPREVSLEEIRALVDGCQQCMLGQTRTNIVFGTGSAQARVLLIGEAPGKNEDLQGEPFVGRAGANLNKILPLAGLTREDIYIANILKCRPPQNRDPKADEILACTPYLREQIRSIWPDVIVTLGNPASHFILKTEVGITKLRGKLYQKGRFVVMPTMHPAAALRNPAWQKLLEEDFAMLGSYLADPSAVEIVNTDAGDEPSDALPEQEA